MTKRIQCARCDKLITIPPYGDFHQDIFIAVSSDPIMHRRVPTCKACFHDWNELQVKVSREFISPQKLDPLPPNKKTLPKLPCRPDGGRDGSGYLM